MDRKIWIKSVISALSCAVLLGNGPLSIHAEENDQVENPFVDVSEEAYYYDAVRWAVENGITNGISEGNFGTDELCTRAQGVTFLWRTGGCQESGTTEIGFQDVNRDSYSYQAVLWGSRNEIVNGISAIEFAPTNTLTRGQFITFLYRMMGEPEVTIESPFTDISENSYYYDAVLWAVENGIASGTSTTMFEPDSGCKRAQAVTFLWRTFGEEDDEDSTLPEEGENEDSILPEEGEDEDSNLPGVGESEEIITPEEEIIIENPISPANAVEYGLSVENTGVKNSKILQALVDALSENGGGTIYIPTGEYEFAEIGTQTIGSHCVKMQSDITIKGDGENTVLKPMGESAYGLDMFYFNEYVDTGEAVYLENCNFEDFVIDSAGTYCRTYTSAGKGFMFNLFKNCNWKNVIVKNTDGTGFGVDCPIGGSMVDCTAIGCGKRAPSNSSSGASGFGIGFGYSEEEFFTIANCKSYNNRVFGFFFEHQGRFNKKKYTATSAEQFLITDCEASGNHNNFGGLQALDTIYQNCVSTNALQDGYYFANSKNCEVVNCISENEANASFVILQSGADGGTQDVSNIIYQQCTSMNSPYGAVVKTSDSTAHMAGNIIMDCQFYNTQKNTIVTEGIMDGLILLGNVSDSGNNNFAAAITHFVDRMNSWNNQETEDEVITDEVITQEDTTEENVQCL